MKSLSSSGGKLDSFVTSAAFQRFITAVICVNAVGLGLETSPDVMAAAGGLIKTADRIALGIYCVEIVLKLIAWRWKFFTSGWNWFDFVVVAISLIPASGPLAVFRALRILRVLRLFSVVPRLRSVVDALLSALPGMGSVVVVMSLVFYVAAVVATKLFGADFPDWFGSIGKSMYSLFQVMTLESWSMGIVRPVMEQFPYAWIFFVPFIIVTSFAVLNLFIALLVNCMQSQHDAEAKAEAEESRKAAHDDTAVILRELRALRSEIAELRKNQMP